MRFESQFLTFIEKQKLKEKQIENDAAPLAQCYICQFIPARQFGEMQLNENQIASPDFIQQRHGATVGS